MLKISIFARYMRKFLIVFSLMMFITSCKVFRSNLMLKTPKNFSYDQLNDSLTGKDYKIAVNDAIVYRVFTNNGYKLIDLATQSNAIFRNDVDVIVESDGCVKMPVLGRIKVAGLTIREAEKLLEERYDTLYVDPFISLRITNKRIIIFPGNGGQAKVLTLSNNNTTLMEAIAYAGGIVEDGKAYKVKLIRNNAGFGQKPAVYLIDLSTIDGIANGNSIVQAGDIIYVEPRYRPLSTFNREFTPIVTLLSSVLILYQFSRITGN